MSPVAMGAEMLGCSVTLEHPVDVNLIKVVAETLGSALVVRAGADAAMLRHSSRLLELSASLSADVRKIQWDALSMLSIDIADAAGSKRRIVTQQLDGRGAVGLDARALQNTADFWAAALESADLLASACMDMQKGMRTSALRAALRALLRAARLSPHARFVDEILLRAFFVEGAADVDFMCWPDQASVGPTEAPPR